RELGLGGAVVTGLGSIVGTGVFVSIAIAAGVTGPSVVLAVVVAAFVAMFNGLSSAQLAAAHPVSGGTYEYGHRLIGRRVGFTAGWLFMAAKSASAATAALGFAGYLLAMLDVDGGRWTRVGIGVAALAVITALVLAGIRRSAAANAVIVSVAIGALVVFSIVGFADAGSSRFSPLFVDGAPGFLEAVALMFVAYTGYGRVATLGEEVRDPARTIPIAVVVTLAVSMLVYLAVAASGVAAAGYEALAGSVGGSVAPLQSIAEDAGRSSVATIVGVGAIAAMLGVLLNLVLGLSRVLLAMGRRGEVPSRLGELDATGRTPTAAVVVSAVIVGGLVAIGDVRATWEFSAFTVLGYYAITNAAALRLAPEHRRFPRAFAWAGLAACLFLAFWVTPAAWLSGLGVVAAGLVWQTVALRRVG
ncbi:MAG TPA: APC family permease, partial [Acidimicrobiia bacterium]|nr:APC family permease [Acidimicrobiia bacterium]